MLIKTHISRMALGLLAVAFFVTTGLCQSVNTPVYTKAEQLIMRRVADGKVTKFGDLPARNRSIPADFVAQLLTGKLRGISISNEGVLIEHAVVKGRLSVAG